MWAYSRAAYRITVLGPPRLGLPDGTIMLATHRRETDVPVICPPMYRRGELWRRRTSFAARDDMFLPGFFAGFPPDLPPRLRRLLFPVAIGRWLPRVEVHPIRSASVARLGEVLRERKADDLAALLGPEELGRFNARAEESGLAPPSSAGDPLRAEYADLLWRPVGPDDPAAAGLDAYWPRRAAKAAAEFRVLVDIVRDGGVLLLFPEGRPSPDGELGPIQRGLAALVRRARPAAVETVALAYDPLVRGRARVTLAFGPPVDPPSGDIEAEALLLLRRAMPLTAGQIAAVALADGEEATVDARAAAAVDEAASEGRPVEPDLLSPNRRRSRLHEALAVGSGRAGDVAFLAREFRSARA